MEPHREISASLFITLIIIVALYLYCKITSTKLNPVNRMPAVKNESRKLVNDFSKQARKPLSYVSYVSLECL